jgi:hypothetical protein
MGDATKTMQRFSTVEVPPSNSKIEEDCSLPHPHGIDIKTG